MFTKLAMTMKALLPLLLIVTLSQAAETMPRASYYKDGEIHITVLGQPETKAITSGHWDFKPSWSITGDHLVFFRRLKDDPDVNNWITAMCIINTDGSGFHQLSDGTFTDFNPTWTRDGKNTPLWNRKVPGKLSYHIMASKIGGKPGEEGAAERFLATWWRTKAGRACRPAQLERRRTCGLSRRLQLELRPATPGAACDRRRCGQRPRPHRALGPTA